MKINVVELFCQAGLCASRTESRRLILQGGAFCNNKNVDSFVISIPENEKTLELRAGKSKTAKVVVVSADA